jgi:lipopolysaccharide transport system permease protein
MLSIYAVVFGGIFNTRWTPDGDIKEFVLMLFCGLQIHTFISETISQSTYCILQNAHYVKKIVFPIELIPLSITNASAFNLIISGLIIIVFLIIDKALPITIFLIPFVVLPLILLTSGLAWLFSSAGVFIRDLNQLVGIIMSILLFLSPIFYPISSVPVNAQKIIKLNPLTFPIEQARNVIIKGELINLNGWLIYTLFSSLIFLFGLFCFQKTRKYFSDLI